MQKNKTEIVAMVKDADWKKIVSKQQTAIMQHTRPFEKEFPCPFNIYFFVPKQKAVCGFGIVEKIIYTHIAEGLAEETGISFQEQQNFSKGEKIFCWYIKHVVVYDESKPIERFGLKRSPHDYRYIATVDADLRKR